MKCPKCGYTSFDYLDECKKCGKDLEEHKEKYSIRSLMFPGAGGAAAAGASAAVAGGAEGGEEFGFDFMEEEAPAAAAEPATEVTEEDTFDFAEEEDSFSFDDDDSF
jgi:hypothetical protein